MTAWPVVKLGDLVRKVGSGATPRGGKNSYQDRGTPLIRSMNVHFAGFIREGIVYLNEEQASALETASVRAEDVLLNITGASIGRVTLAPSDLDGARVNQHVCIIRPNRAIAPAFLSHFLASPQIQTHIFATQSGVTRQALTKGKILDFDVPVPPVPEQHRIVAAIESYFTRLDDAVATLERVQRNLKRYRASVLKSAVEGRLVPTEAELARAEGRDYEPASILLERILAERRRRWEEAELAKMRAKGKEPKNDKWKAKYKEPVAPEVEGLPELPEGWCWATWSQVGISQNGRAFPSKEYCKDGVKLLRPGNLHVSGRVEWPDKNTRHMPVRWADEFPGYIIGPNELVMNLTAQSLKDEFLGRVCLTGGADRCLLNQRLARLSPAVVEPRFLLWWFKTPLFRRFVDGLNTGSLIQHMFTSQLDDFVMPLPPLAEQDRIVAALDTTTALLQVVERDLNSNQSRVDRLRQSILKWAFEGRLVDQDPTDEPASVLLDRIRAERQATATKKKPARKPRRKKKEPTT